MSKSRASGAWEHDIWSLGDDIFGVYIWGIWSLDGDIWGVYILGSVSLDGDVWGATSGGLHLGWIWQRSL